MKNRAQDHRNRNKLCNCNEVHNFTEVVSKQSVTYNIPVPNETHYAWLPSLRIKWNSFMKALCSIQE
jgi:hypothetical protein